MKRYRAAIYVDIWEDNIDDASKELGKYINDIPNSFTGGISEMPHGSEISLVETESNDS